MSDNTTFTDVFVAVHGIGAQSRFATVRSVATQMAGSKTLLAQSPSPVAPQPLGYFHSDVQSMTSTRLVDDKESLKGDLASIGFAEVFWADIPQDVDKEGRTLEETKAWARTVVARANALCAQAKTSRNHSIIPPDFSLAGEVLDDVIDTVHVLENLSVLATKTGLFKFDLAPVLREYLGDVQLVAEFTYHRTDIVGRFHSAMESIYNQCKKTNPNVRIHIVAHSEGTVVSFLGLLYAMSGGQVSPANPKTQTDAKIHDDKGTPEWLHHIHGFMTIGSPIDKHILLWPRLFKGLEPKKGNGIFAARKEPIHWRNYYDHGDPVGFKLDSTRHWLRHVECKAFEFCGCAKCQHDIGFSRYLFPGEAHNEYWNDSEVFEHFIKDVVKRPRNNPPPTPPPSPRPKPPATKPHVALFSVTIPYVLCFLILFAGVFFLHKALYNYTHPSSDPLQKFVRFTQLGVSPPEDVTGGFLFWSVFGIAGLIAGATMLARIPRLAMGRRLWTCKQKTVNKLADTFPKIVANPTWTAVAVVAFVIGCVMYSWAPLEMRNELGARFSRWGTNGPTLGILAMAAVGGMSGYLSTSRRLGNSERRQRWVSRGTRPLLICGAVVIAAVVALQILFPPDVDNKADEKELSGWTETQKRLIQEVRNGLTPDQIATIKEIRLTPQELNQIIVTRGMNWSETLEKVRPVLATTPPVWPVVIGSLAFLYLWWLSMLLFDLTFIWHRYIRHSTTNDRLREWNSYGFSPLGKQREEDFCKE